MSVTAYEGDLYVHRMPGLEHVFRCRIDNNWRAVLHTALAWTCDSGACSEKEMDDGLRKILASYPELSRFEREVIFTYATHRDES